jgi:glutathione S-transferase
MRQLWGRPNSSNVMKVVWLLERLAVPYQRIDIGGPFGGTDSADYRRMNPNGRIPTLVEDGFTLWESNAILRYVAATCSGGEAVWPTDPRARANVDRWMDWQQTTIDAPQGVLFKNLIRTAAPLRDAAAIERAAQELRLGWALLDKQLAGQDFVAGAEFSLADIALGVHVHRWFAFDIEKPDLPALEGWYRRLLKSEIYRKHGALPVV